MNFKNITLQKTFHKMFFFFYLQFKKLFFSMLKENLFIPLRHVQCLGSTRTVPGKRET